MRFRSTKKPLGAVHLLSLASLLIVCLVLLFAFSSIVETAGTADRLPALPMVDPLGPVVGLAEDGSLTLNGERTLRTELRDKLGAILLVRSEKTVLLKADGGVTMQKVGGLASLLQASGASRLLLESDSRGAIEWAQSGGPTTRLVRDSVREVRPLPAGPKLPANVRRVEKGPPVSVAPPTTVSVQWLDGVVRRRTSGVLPVFPKGERVSASVKLGVVVRPDGHLKTVSAVQKSGRKFEEAAVRGIRTWRFEPLRKTAPRKNYKCLVTVSFQSR